MEITADKVKLPKLTPAHPASFPIMVLLNPQQAFAVVQPDILPGVLAQPGHIYAPAQSLYIFKETLYIPGVEVH